MTSTRAGLAVIVVALWLGGLAMMHRRNANVSEAQQLAQVALRLQPQTYYYTIEQDGLADRRGIFGPRYDGQLARQRGVFRRRLPVGEVTRADIGTLADETDAGIRLNDLTIDIARPTRAFSIKASIQEDTLLYIAGTRRRVVVRQLTTLHSPAVYAVACAGSLHAGRSAHDWAKAEVVRIRSYDASRDPARAADSRGITIHRRGQRRC